MKRFCITLLTLLFIILSSLSFVGCGEIPTPPPEVEDEGILDELLKFRFNYEFSSFHTYTSIRYRGLWKNTFENHPTDVFLTEYGEEEDGYYLLYMKTDKFAEYMPWIGYYHSAHKLSPRSEHDQFYFSTPNEHGIIDGKYLCAYQMDGNGEKDIFKVCKADTIDDITLFHGQDYKLILCAKAKRITIKENLSTHEVINRPITLYRREVLQFNGGFFPEEYEYNRRWSPWYWDFMDEKYFEYEGLLLETGLRGYQEMTSTSMPYRGYRDDSPSLVRFVYDAMVYEEDGNRYVAMHRYYRGKNHLGESIETDYLLDDLGFADRYEDYYNGYTDQILGAFVKEYEGEVPKAFLGTHKSEGNVFGLFDYDAIRALIDKRME